jgi:nicotinate-nucleotide adenylyltransferase
MLDSMRIGIYGGTFDPVHFGHLLLAECCEQQAGLDRVDFMPAARQPHKPYAPRASDADRLAMLELAIAGRSTWVAATLEIERGGVSYTVDTLRDYKAREPDAALFLLMGADALADLPKWREPRAICAMAAPLVVRRAGSGEPEYERLRPLVSAERFAEITERQVQMPATPISSSEIQRSIAAGGPWRELVPPAVADYIDAKGLYRSA